MNDTAVTTAPTFRSQLPALDGMRGIGIIVVLLYHQSFGWFPNGVLVISMFFTLSGFLLTRLAVREVQTTGRLDLGRFWSRRVRRLMPASLAVIAAVAAASWLWPKSTRPSSNGDVWSGLTYWENWHLFATNSRYEELNGNVSPLLHLWSLSLEEQVFLLFPLLMIAVLILARRQPRVGVAAIGLLCATGFALGPLFERRSISAAYYATPVRVAEFLAGVLVALVIGQSPMLLARLRRAHHSLLAQALFTAAVAGEIVVWLTFGITEPSLFPWGVAISSVLTAVIMLASETSTLAATVLALRPLAWLGVRVYGIYLVHWPVFRFLDAATLGLDGAALFAVRCTTTLAISEGLYRLFEDPIRRGIRWPGRQLYVGCAALAVAAAAVGVVAVRNQPAPIVDSEAIRIQQVKLAGLPQVPDDAPTHSEINPSLPARVLIVGDSQAYVLAGGLGQWAKDNGVWVEYNSGVGCGIGGITPIRYLSIEYEQAPGCAEFEQYRPLILERFRPNLVVVIGGLGDLSDRQIDDSGTWRHIGQSEYDAWLTDELAGFIDESTSTGASLLWLTHPDVDVPFRAGGTGPTPFVENDPERMAAYNALITSLPQLNTAVQVADFAGEVRGVPGGQFDPDLRPDGTHFDFTAAPQLIDWVTEQIDIAYADT